MGRTIPSFRLATLVEKDEWKEFRDRLGKSDKKLFDRMISISHLYNSACSYAAGSNKNTTYNHGDYFSSLCNIEWTRSKHANKSNQRPSPK